MEDLLRQNFKKEQIDGYFCQKCQKNVAATKSQLIVEVPPILVIHVSRLLGFGSHHKASHPIDYPLTSLNLGEFVDKKNEKKPDEIEFDLVAVVAHFGVANKGHYVAYCWNDQVDSWLEYNDLKVRQITGKHLLDATRETAHMLIYERR